MLCRENASFCLLLIHNYLQRKAEFFGAHVQLGAAESILSYIAAKAITPCCWHTQLLMANFGLQKAGFCWHIWQQTFGCNWPFRSHKPTFNGTKGWRSIAIRRSTTFCDRRSTFFAVMNRLSFAVANQLSFSVTDGLHLRLQTNFRVRLRTDFHVRLQTDFHVRLQTDFICGYKPTSFAVTNRLHLR